jgi:hypothetical protein
LLTAFGARVLANQVKRGNINFLIIKMIVGIVKACYPGINKIEGRTMARYNEPA